jgi:hypothetical protein
MRRLLIIPDSARRNIVLKVRNLPAIEAFDSTIIREIKKAKKEGKFPPSLDILILTPFHGFRKPEDLVRYYEQRMTRERAMELRSSLIDYLVKYVKEKGYAKVHVLLEGNYREAIAGFEKEVVTPVEYVIEGMGSPTQRLKEIIEGK